MSSIKDKLTQSVRQARSSQPAKAAAGSASRSGAAPARKAAEKPAPAAKAALASKPTTQTASRPKAVSLAVEPASSATTLFPQRVWPD
ncbi:MAG: hypothetical protein JXR43_12905 [Burkholderiaceae bacterium]|nr:hypothetical protein [Burkholderiaceae bacterium]